jgi:hypothetical protein
MQAFEKPHRLPADVLLLPYHAAMNWSVNLQWKPALRVAPM